MAPGWEFRRWRLAALAAALLATAGVAAPDPIHAQQRIALQPVAGASEPIFVTHAGDDTHRLFVLERSGRIKVLAPGFSVPTLFLDISPRVLSGGEQGLLGLAFHPDYRRTGRFYVNYTRQPDGATVIAEYRVNPGDPNIAGTGERALLVIGQPFANHNGGMLAFGPDGFLYIGLGDGGSAFDPDRRAQDPTDLLGKILRIDVDPPAGSAAPYASPPDNPFAGAPTGRPEIYALGFRNPWRFSFDRATGALIAADVGQGQREEIDVVTRGGNYGWPILEGGLCHGLGARPCSDPGLIAPVAEYDHAGGRCSVTGGYAYRGDAGTLPAGAYVFADFCSGEIFLLHNGATSVLLASGLAITSFGEDEAGEIYVASLGGALHRLVNPDAPVLRLRLDRERVSPGQTVRATLSVATGAAPVAADGYLGIVFPDGETVFFAAPGQSFQGVTAALSGDARGFAALAPGAVLAPGISATIADAFVYTPSGDEPTGQYLVFAVLARPGALADGRVDPGDLLAVTAAPVFLSR